METADDLGFVDEVLARSGACTKRLAVAGRAAVSLIVDAKGSVRDAYVVRSTVRDCAVVDCVKKQLTRARAPAPKSLGLYNVEVALLPGEPAGRVQNVKWPEVAETRYCVDPADALAEFQSGRLPPEQIQSVIRNRYSEIRKCYESGLASNPELRGKVVTRFVIGRDGRVSAAHILENEVRDCRVARCVREEIAKCVFPSPETGIVTVVYPIMFETG